jgi:hypothetical protein
MSEEPTTRDRRTVGRLELVVAVLVGSLALELLWRDSFWLTIAFFAVVRPLVIWRYRLLEGDSGCAAPDTAPRCRLRGLVRPRTRHRATPLVAGGRGCWLRGG